MLVVYGEMGLVRSEVVWIGDYGADKVVSVVNVYRSCGGLRLCAC